MLTSSHCRHCAECRTRRRGLCWRCYAAPEIRRRYRSLSKFAKGAPDEDDFNGGYGLPARPTAALPGTPEKIRALAARAEARTALWHPQDARLDADLGPWCYLRAMAL
ncbi:MAG: hypothetical protein JNM56_22460 [Planctomycetia bacterium]|nr:hypothetical protein [Planctomycetia bacterium]